MSLGGSPEWAVGVETVYTVADARGVQRSCVSGTLSKYQGMCCTPLARQQTDTNYFTRPRSKSNSQA